MPLRTRLNPAQSRLRSFNRGMVAQTGLLPEGALLLQDSRPLKILDLKNVINESVAGGVPAVRMTGVFQMADESNENGRYYPGPVMTEAVAAIQEDIVNRGVWGQLDHPPDAKISLDRVSHLNTRLWMEGKKVLGEAEIWSDLPFGSPLIAMLRHGRVGLSSRGVGDLEQRDMGGQETTIVREGYRFVTFDVVAEPSVTQAIMHITESKNRKPKRTQVFFPKAIFEARLLRKLRSHLDLD